MPLAALTRSSAEPLRIKLAKSLNASTSAAATRFLVGEQVSGSYCKKVCWISVYIFPFGRAEFILMRLISRVCV